MSKNLKELDDRSLVVQEVSLARELAGMRFRLSLGQAEDTSQVPQLRKARARVLTEIRRREIAESLPKGTLQQRHHSAAQASLNTDGGADAASSSEQGGLFAGLRKRLGRQS